jgi:epidermal growth factor receptor substrate 15
MDATKIQRESIEHTLARQISQLSALQTQLASAKAAYEVKMRRLSALKERLTMQTAHLESAQEHLIRVEGDMGCANFSETPSGGDGAGDSVRDHSVLARSQPTRNGNGNRNGFG